MATSLFKSELLPIQLGEWITKGFRLRSMVKEELKELSAAIEMLRCDIADAEVQQVRIESLKLWLERVKDLIYDGEDILDEWCTRFLETHVQGIQLHATDIQEDVLTSSCYSFSQISIHLDHYRRIEKLNKRLEQIRTEKKQFRLISRNVELPHETPRPLVVVSAIQVHGFTLEKEIIATRLLGENNHQGSPVQVISIVGMGGSGKTALARFVFGEENVMATFQMRMWVCVSEPFDRFGIAEAIIQESTGQAVPVSESKWETLLLSLRNAINGKRFLLVLDDVWTDEPNQWAPFKDCLGGGARGSRILVTTRREGVAAMMGSTYFCNLGRLAEEDCWSLFKDVAFVGREGDLRIFEDIGRNVMARCHGNPLAVKTLASFMRFKLTVEDWRTVSDSDIWEVPQIEHSLFSSLLMSYYAMPLNLRQCFLYCAIFPKNMEIYKDYLVKLWMAQGFLSFSASRSPEMVGEHYFGDMIMCSFFEDYRKDAHGNTVSCKMHNMVHDFVKSLTKRECALTEMNGVAHPMSQVRHVTTRNMENSSIYSATNLRTLLRPFDDRRSTFTVPIKLFRRLVCLRALDLSRGAFQELPSKVGRLLHLRYLDLSHTKLQKLPGKVVNLRNLQTLKLNECRKLQKLPEGIGMLSNMRHLEIEKTKDLRCLPRSVSKLSFLQTLNKFIVGGVNHGCRMKELQPLNGLQGKLKIDGLSQVPINEAAEAELQNKRNLRKLTLNFGYGGDAVRMVNVLQNLQPHQNLEELKIKRYLGSMFPSWIEDDSVLTSLLTLELTECENCEQLPPLGKMETLGMTSMDVECQVTQV